MKSSYTSLLAGTILVAAYTSGAVQPFVEEVKCNCDGTFSATFGYRHKGYGRSEVEHGPTNKLAGADSVYSRSKPLPMEFQPGEKRQVFSVRFSGEQVKWVLGGHRATALADSADFSCVSDVPEGAVEAARNKLPSTTKLLPDFDSSRIELGDPLMVFTLSQDARDRFETGDDIWSLVGDAKCHWVFPLWYDSETIGRIEIHERDGEWTSLRSGGCAVSFSGLHRTWGREKGFNPFLIRMPHSYYDEYWFTVPEKGRRNLTKIKEMDEQTIESILSRTPGRENRPDSEYHGLGVVDSIIAQERRSR
jgi:hypothetical protein